MVDHLMVKKTATEFGDVLDSTRVTRPRVHVVMVANHVNQKLQSYSCQWWQLRCSTSCV